MATAAVRAGSGFTLGGLQNLSAWHMGLWTASGGEIWALSLVLLAAGIAKGVTGIGMPVVGIPLLSMFLNIKQSISLITMPLILTNVAQAVEGGRSSSVFRRLLIPIASFAPGCLIGFEILFRVDEHAARATAGLALISVALLTGISKRAERFWATRHTDQIGFSAGILAGVVAGLSGVAGPPVFLYLLGFNPSPREFTKSVAIYLVAANGIMALLLFQGARMDMADVLVSLVATVPAFLGMLVGQRVRDRLPATVFRRLALVFVLAAAAQLTCSGISGLWS